MVDFLTEFDPQYGTVVAVAAGLKRLVCKNPGPFTFTGTGTYTLVGDDGAIVVDPGPMDHEHLDAVAVMAGTSPILAVLLTHRHADHAGGARALADRVKAPICAAAWPEPTSSLLGEHLAGDAEPDADGTAGLLEAADEAIVALVPDRLVVNDDRIEIGSNTLEAIATPGHIADHTCFVWREGKALFSGDHVMGWATSVVPPPFGNLAQYLASLRRLDEFGDFTFYPTHGPPIPNAGGYVRQLHEHRMMRTAQILDRLNDGPATIPDLVRRMYIGLDERLIPAACMSVWAHLEMLVADGLAAVSDGASPTILSRYELIR